MASSRLLIAATVLLAFCCAQVALAQPCIACKDCNGSNHCLGMCKRECPKPEIKVDLEKCKRFGREAGEKVAKESCQTTRTYCNQGQKGFGASRKTPVTLQQCGNIAFGVCESRAAEVYMWWGECSQGLRWGEKACNKDQFKQFFTGEVNDRCNQAVAWIDQQQQSG